MKIKSMKVDEKRSELFDYLMCLQFLKEDPLEQNNSLFEKILDPSYRTLREELLKPLKEHVNLINRYANTAYNMITHFFQMMNPKSANDFFSQFEHAPKETFAEIICEMLSLSTESEDITAKHINQTDLLDEYKWAIYSFLSDFEQQRSALLHFLKEQYPNFCEKRKILLQKTASQKSQLLKRLEDEQKELFLSFLPEDSANKAFEQKTFFFLVASPTLFYLHKKEKNSLLAIGCYLFEYFSIKEKVQKEFVEKRKKYLKILSDETRYGILQKITEGVSSNKILAQMFGLSAPGVSYQLNALMKSEMIHYSKQKGRYVLNEEELQKVFSSILLDFGISKTF